MELIPFYKALLTDIGLVVSESGAISMNVSDNDTAINMPVSVSDKLLVLPTNENLKKVMKENIMIFHPLNEDLERGPSKVLEFFRLYARNEIEVQLIMLIENLYRISASEDVQKTLSPEQSKILDVIKGPKKTIMTWLEKFQAIRSRLDVNVPDKSLVHIYLRRSGKVGEKAYRQVAVVSFPIYNELKQGERTILGVKVTNAFAESLIATFEYIFPHIFTKGSYSLGSNSRVAPKFEAVISATASLMMCIETVVKIVNTESAMLFPECDIHELKWAEQIGKFEEMLNSIIAVPMQRGNEGSVEEGSEGFNAVNTTASVTTSKANPADVFRSRLAGEDSPPWEHNPPSKPKQNVLDELDDPQPVQPVKSTEISPLTAMLRQQSAGQFTPVMHPVHPQPFYQPQPHHMAPQGVSPLTAMLRQQSTFQPPVVGFPPGTNPYGFGDESNAPFAHYGAPNRRR